MTIDLVPRASRAVAEQLNKYYRVFKGIDPETVLIRLPAGGAFQVRHSVTNNPILSVSDAGFDATLGTSDLGDGIVTTPKLADQAVTTPKLADGSVTTIKLAGGLTGQLVSVTIGASATTSAVMTSIIGSGLGVNAGTRPVLVGVSMISFSGTLAASVTVEMREGAAQVAPVLSDTVLAGQFTTRTTTWVIAPTAGPHNYLLAWMTSAGQISFGGAMFWALVI